VRRTVIPWFVAAGLLLAVTVGGVVLANATVFSASSFARLYLSALERGDAASALQLRGVEAGSAADDFLIAAAMAELGDVEQLRDVEFGGAHEITYSWRSGSTAGRTTFTVERVGSSFGLFPQWGFSVSPIAVAEVSTPNDPRFRVNGVEAVAGSDAGSSRFAVFSPGAYTVDTETRLLSSVDVRLDASAPGEVLPVTVEAQANGTFLDEVDGAIRDHLDGCATQQVLYPAGCPFGETVRDRITSDPVWTIAEYPDIAIRPSGERGVWTLPEAAGAAHLVVDIKSLFDGSVSTFDADVPFTLAYRIEVDVDDAVTLTAVYE
jgi:hypothetical protein